MDLTQYKLDELVEDCKIKINTSNILYKNLKLFAFLLAFEALVLCPLTLNFINPVIYLLLVAITAPIKVGSDLLIPRMKKKRANQKLEEVVEILRQHGIETSKTKLKRSKIASHYLKCIINDDEATMTSKHVVLFQDKNEQLKALKQARVELFSFHIPFRHGIIGETRIISDE